MDAAFMVGAIGGFFLAHAAYSTIQYRGVLKIMEEFSAPPMSLVLELLLGLALSVWAGLWATGKFVSILPDSKDNRIVSISPNLDFMIFNHRGRALPSNTESKLRT